MLIVNGGLSLHVNNTELYTLAMLWNWFNVVYKTVSLKKEMLVKVHV